MSDITTDQINQVKQWNSYCDDISLWIELVAYTIVFIASLYSLLTIVLCRKSRNRPLICMLVSLFFAGCSIFPYGIIAIVDYLNNEQQMYHTWSHFLGSTGLFFSGLTYWIFAAAYLKTALILTKLIKRMKLDIYSNKDSGQIGE